MSEGSTEVVHEGLFIDLVVFNYVFAVGWRWWAGGAAAGAAVTPLDDRAAAAVATVENSGM